MTYHVDIYDKMMRRSHIKDYYEPPPSCSSEFIEIENEDSTEHLKDKVNTLKSLSIDIGAEANSSSNSNTISWKINTNQNDPNNPIVAGQSVNTKTIDAGNVQITIQPNNNRGVEITVRKGENKDDIVGTSKTQDQPIKKDTEKKSPRKKSPRKKSPRKK
ncbi:hypothetical protein ACI65C_005465 [Semiaphis heraclei]